MTLNLLPIQNQKKYSQREKENRDNLYSDLIKNNITNINKNIGNISFSYDKLKKIKKVKNNNTFTNITTNISDKDNISSRKNNIATNNSNNLNSNNIHYFTTNFNSSTNITEKKNDLYNKIKNTKEKKSTKKKKKKKKKHKIAYASQIERWGNARKKKIFNKR